MLKSATVIQSLTKQLDAEKAECLSLKKFLLGTEGSTKRINELESAKHELIIALDEKTKECARLTENYNSLNLELSSMEKKHKAEYQKVESKHSTLVDQQIIMLKDEINSLNAETTVLRTDKQSLLMKISYLESKISDMEVKAPLAPANAGEQKLIDSLRNEKKELLRELAKYSDYEELELFKDRYENDKKHWVAMRNVLENKIVELDNDLQSYEKKEIEFKALIKKYEFQLTYGIREETAANGDDILHAALAKSTRQLNKLSEVLSDLENRYVERQLQYINAVDLCNTIEAENDALKTMLAESKNQYINAMDSINSLEEENFVLQGKTLSKR